LSEYKKVVLLKKNQMKNGLYLIITFISLSLSNGVIAQSETRQIRKEVQMEMLDDVITLTITTTDGEKITEEIYTGEEAKQMLAELEKVDEEKIVSSQEVREEFIMEEVEGINKLTIRRTADGIETEELFFGPEADKKIKELESRQNTPIKIEMNTEEDHSHE
jgi:hypothetical protein